MGRKSGSTECDCCIPPIIFSGDTAFAIRKARFNHKKEVESQEVISSSSNSSLTDSNMSLPRDVPPDVKVYFDFCKEALLQDPTYTVSSANPIFSDDRKVELKRILTPILEDKENKLDAMNANRDLMNARMLCFQSDVLARDFSITGLKGVNQTELLVLMNTQEEKILFIKAEMKRRDMKAEVTVIRNFIDFCSSKRKVTVSQIY